MAERLLEVYCVLIPLADGRLILPRSCVAEVVGHSPPAEMPGAPPWYLGTFAWSGSQVPLVSFEGICGQPIPPVTGRTRIVIVHCLGDELEGGVFGVVAQGFPQVVRATSDVVRPDNSRPIPDPQLGPGAATPRSTTHEGQTENSTADTRRADTLAEFRTGPSVPTSTVARRPRGRPSATKQTSAT